MQNLFTTFIITLFPTGTRTKIIRQCLGILLFGLVFSTVKLTAQDINDFSTWSVLEFEYEPDKKWELGLEAQLRLKENSSTVDEYFAELKGSRELGKDFKFELGLRYIRENDTRGNIQGFENHFRWNLDGNYEYEIGRFDLQHRLRYTNKTEFGLAEEADKDFAGQRLRFKTSAVYKIKDWKLDPEFAAELFSRFGQDTDSEVDKYRLTLGSAYGLKDAGEISFYYRFESDFAKLDRESEHILGIKYKYTLKNKK